MALDSVINVRYPKDSPFVKDREVNEQRRMLIDTYQKHECTERCRRTDRSCSLGYPQKTAPETTIRNGRVRWERGEDEVLIVTHNPTLLERFRCHHCLEVIHSNQAIGYVLKYCTKNSDPGQVRMDLQRQDSAARRVRYEGREVDRTQKLEYYAATRVLSAPECFAQIAGFWRHHLNPTVLIFSIHLEGKKVVLAASRADALDRIDIPSPVERYFNRPDGSPYDQLTFLDYHSNYSLEPPKPDSDLTNLTLDKCPRPRIVKPRPSPILCMLGAVNVKKTELFAMRILLRQFPARGWESLREHAGRVWPTFREAVQALGIISDRQDEARICLTDAAEMNRPPSDMRFLLAQMVRYGADPIPLEDEFADQLAEPRRPNETRQQIHEQIMRMAHESDLSAYADGDSLPDRPDPDSLQSRPRMDPRDPSFDPVNPSAGLNMDQEEVARRVINAVSSSNPPLMFQQGAAGTGNTFTVRRIVKLLSRRQKKCLICATTGIAAVQYPGGCTLHSLFKLGIDEQAGAAFISGVGKHTPHAAYLQRADLIIIDEVSMLTPWVANRVSKTLQSIADPPEKYQYFAGKSILFVGDFLQLPPVMPNYALPVIRRLITYSAYWPTMIKFKLAQPMRARNPSWAKFLNSVATGKLPSGTKWADLHTTFGVTVTQDLDTAKEFLCYEIEPQNYFPLDRLWICATNN
jgi:hypothetical protein